MRVLAPVVFLDHVIAIAAPEKQPPPMAPYFALGLVPLVLYREPFWGVLTDPPMRRHSWIVARFWLGFIPILIPGGCLVWTHAPTIKLLGRRWWDQRVPAIFRHFAAPGARPL